MFHILPCANEGSFEHMICTLRADGIKTDRELRFFHDEEGHLRRLNTNQLAELWAGDRFKVMQEWYAGHMMGSVENLTRWNWGQICSFADPAKGVNAKARHKLAFIRLGLITLWLFRRPLAIIDYKREFGCKSVRDLLLLGGSLLGYPVGIIVDAGIRYLARREWRCKRSEPGGSEMYVVLGRSQLL